MKNTFKITQYERKLYEPRGEGSRSVAEVIEHLRRFVKKYILKNENISWDTHQSILALFPDVKVKKETLDCYASSVFKKIKSVYKYSELNDVQKQYVNTKIAKYFSFMRNKCRDIIYSPDIKGETKELAKFFYNENNTKAFGSVLNFPNEDCIFIVNNTPVISLIGWKLADTVDTDKGLYEYVTADFNDVNLSFDAIDPTERFYSQYHYFNESETPYTEPNVNEINKLYQKGKGTSDDSCNSDGTDNTSTNSNPNNGEQINHVWPKVETEHWETESANDSSATDSATSTTSSSDDGNSNSDESSSAEDLDDWNSDNGNGDDSYKDDIDELNELSGDSSKEIFDDLDKNQSSENDQNDEDNLDQKDKDEREPDAEFPDMNENLTQHFEKETNNPNNKEEISSTETTEITEEIITKNPHRLCKIILASVLVFLLILLILLLILYFCPNLRPEFVNRWITDEQTIVDNQETQMLNGGAASVGGDTVGGANTVGGAGTVGGVGGSSGAVGGADSGMLGGEGASNGATGSSVGGSSSVGANSDTPSMNLADSGDDNQTPTDMSDNLEVPSSDALTSEDNNEDAEANEPNEIEEQVPEYHKKIATANMEDMKLSYIFLDDSSSVRVIMSDSNKEVCSINSNLQTIDDKKVLTTNKEETKDKCGFEITKIECNSNFANCYLVFDSMGWRVAVGSSGITNMPKKDSENNSQKNDKETPKTPNDAKQQDNQKNQVLL